VGTGVARPVGRSTEQPRDKTDALGGPPRYTGDMPDTPLPAPLGDVEIEQRLLAAAIAEAKAENVWHDHAVVRAHLVAEIARLRAKLDQPRTP
jgi:hypothetical protein